jgi:E3 ubiquitin-protein ligase SHPRH
LSYWRTVISALLLHGTGLCVGPDADGLLNFCDTPHAEVAAALTAPPAELQSRFNIDDMLGSVGFDGARPAAPLPPGLAAVPKQYQLTGLGWMLDREKKGDAVGRGRVRLHPGWTQLVTADGKVLYLHQSQDMLMSTAFISGTYGWLNSVVLPVKLSSNHHTAHTHSPYVTYPSPLL